MKFLFLLLICKVPSEVQEGKSGAKTEQRLLVAVVNGVNVSSFAMYLFLC